MIGMSPVAAGEPPERFVQAIKASVAYWLERTRQLGDEDLGRLDEERRNLYRAVQFGLSLPQTWEETTEIVLGAVPLAERRIYWQEWIALLEELVEKCPAGNRELAYRLTLELGRFYNKSRRLDDAVEIHQNTLVLAQEQRDVSLLAKAHYNLGRDYHEMRDYERSQEQAWTVLNLLVDGAKEDRWLEAEAEKMLAMAAESRGEVNEALVRMERAVDIWRTIHHSTGQNTELARALNDLGNTLRTAKQQDEAIERYKEAATLLASTANELDKINVQMNLAVMYFDKEEWATAETILHQADSRWLRQSGHLQHQGYIAGNLGSVLIKQERWAEAEHALRRAIGLWEQLNDDLMLALYVGTLGEALAPQGRAGEAERCFDRALGLLEKYPDHAFAGRIRASFIQEKEKLEKEKT